MFNSKKPGASLSKFDKKMYEFEKKKQMIEELRVKEKNNQLEREKVLRDREINSLFRKDNVNKINTDLKKNHVEDPGSGKFAKTHDKYTIANSLEKKEKIKIQNEKEEEKINNISDNVIHSLQSNESNSAYNQTITSNQTQTNINLDSKTDMIIESEKIYKIDKPIEKQPDTIKVVDDIKTENEITKKSSSSETSSVDEKKHEKPGEKTKSPNLTEELTSGRKFSFQFQETNNKVEKSEKVDKPIPRKLTDGVNESDNLTNLPHITQNNTTDKKSFDKTSADIAKDPSITICSSPVSISKDKNVQEESAAELVDDSLLGKKSSYKLINLSNEKNEAEKSEKIENKITENILDLSPIQISSLVQNNSNIEKKEPERVEKSENFVNSQLNAELLATSKTPLKPTLSSSIDKRITEPRKDFKRETRREPRKEIKKEEKKEDKKDLKRDISKKIPEKKIDKKDEKKESKEDKKEIKEEKKETEVIKEERKETEVIKEEKKETEVIKEEKKETEVILEKEKPLDNNKNNIIDTVVNNFIDKTNTEATSGDDLITKKEIQNYHKKSLSEFNMPKVEDFHCDRSKIEESTENINYESERDIYNVFLYESVPNQKEPLQLLLRDQMKNIIYNMKDRKKEIETVKVDKKKQILENLSRINDSTISKEIIRDPKSAREIIIESSYNNSFFNQSEVKKEFQTRDLTNLIEDSFLNRNQLKKSTDKDNNNLAKLIKEFENEFRKNDFEKDKIRLNPDDIINPNEVSSIHLSNNTDNEKNKKKKSITIDFEDYLKENRDEGETMRLETNQNLEYQDETENGHKLYNNIVNKIQNITDASKVERTHLTMADDSIMFSKNRSELLVFGDYENPHDYEEKIKKLEKLREKKMKVMEKKKEESRIKGPTNDNSNINVSIDSKIMERNKTPSKRQKSVSVKFEEKAEVIQIPSKRPTQAVTYENQQINNNPQKPTPGFLNEKQDLDKSQNTRSKSQLPLYNEQSQKNKIPQSVRADRIEVKKNPRDEVAPIKILRKEGDSTKDVVIHKDYSGNKTPKYVVSYNKLSNKKTIKSAIRTVCLAAEPHRACREKILEIIESCPCENFIILFKGNFGRFDLKAVYTFNPQNQKTELLTSLSPSPDIIESHMIQIHYKYDLIQKEFKILPDTKEISVIVDAVAISNNR